ncbi:hypothetical protein FQR65_LT14999 [Abscondita terminalis]|nr:hypothetical protein FQR65_LT14999 [Abscondita terminalis]
MDAVDDANDVDTTDDLENTQHCILNDENNSSQDSTMIQVSNSCSCAIKEKKIDDSMVNEAYEAMKKTLTAKKPKDVFTICGEEVAVTLRNLPNTTYAQAIVQHKINFKISLALSSMSQQYFLPPANSGGLLTILPPQQSPESYSSCSSGNPPTPALSTSTMTTDEDEAVDNFLTQLQTPRHHTSQ